jgi:hypothetical protein
MRKATTVSERFSCGHMGVSGQSCRICPRMAEGAQYQAWGMEQGFPALTHKALHIVNAGNVRRKLFCFYLARVESALLASMADIQATSPFLADLAMWLPSYCASFLQEETRAELWCRSSLSIESVLCFGLRAFVDPAKAEAVREAALKQDVGLGLEPMAIQMAFGDEFGQAMAKERSVWLYNLILPALKLSSDEIKQALAL